jgi:hypothetical protein
MFRILHDMPPGTVGVEAVGKVTEEDYRTVPGPAVGDALKRRDLRLLYVLGRELDSYSSRPRPGWWESPSTATD